MTNLQKICLIDGIRMQFFITEFVALSIIRNLEMKTDETKRYIRSELNFIYCGFIANMRLTIKYSENKWELTIRGSIPVFANNTNSIDITWDIFYKKIIEVIETITPDILIINGQKKEKMELLYFLNKVEVGCNALIEEIENIDKFLFLNLVSHRKKVVEKENNTYYFKHENYTLKLYQKQPNVLRVEIVLLQKELKKYGLKTHKDLNQSKTKPIYLRLINEIDNIVFLDDINLHLCDNLTKKEQFSLMSVSNNCRNNRYDDDLKISNQKDKNKYRQRMYRLKKKSKKIIQEKGVFNLKSKLIEALKSGQENYF